MLRAVSVLRREQGMLSYLVPIFPPLVGQNDIKALQVAQSKDLFCKRQQGIMFVDRELRREGTEDPVFDGAPRPQRPTSVTDSKASTAPRGAYSSDEVSNRQRVAEMEAEIKAKRDELKRLQRKIVSCEQQHLQSLDLINTLFLTLRGRSTTKGVRMLGSSSDARKLQAAVNTVLGQSDADVARLRQMTAPNTVMGALFDAAVQRMEKGKHHVRYSPRLLQFAIMVAQKSPTAYKSIRAACPHLPTQRRLSSLVDSAAVNDELGSSKHLLKSAQSQMRRYGKKEVHGTLLCDEVKICSGLVLRVSYVPRPLSVSCVQVSCIRLCSYGSLLFAGKHM